jgi:hypothetical protein
MKEIFSAKARHWIIMAFLEGRLMQRDSKDRQISPDTF